MSESEFDIIKNHFVKLNSDGEQPNWLVKGIGDDTAIINPSDEAQLLIAMDTLNSGVHFPEDTPAAEIGYKALAVNLSDIAAMGGEPTWFTLSVSLPESNFDWISNFCAGMSELVEQYDLKLIGGDTTRGPLSVTVQISGEVPMQQALTRAGAKPDDDIYVTGYPGEAAAGLKLKKQNVVSDQNTDVLIHRLNHPTPRIEIGIALRNHAHACIDVSDGLVADLGHILDESQIDSGRVLGAELNKQALPISNTLQAVISDADTRTNLVLHGGDDYELCFTAAPSNRDVILSLAKQFNLPITCIGKIIEQTGVYMVDEDGRHKINETGFEHFK